LDNTAVDFFNLEGGLQETNPFQARAALVSTSQTILEANRKISDMQGEQCGNGQSPFNHVMANEGVHFL